MRPNPSGWTTIEFSPLLLSNVNMLSAGSDVVDNIIVGSSISREPPESGSRSSASATRLLYILARVGRRFGMGNGMGKSAGPDYPHLVQMQLISESRDRESPTRSSVTATRIACVTPDHVLIALGSCDDPTI